MKSLGHPKQSPMTHWCSCIHKAFTRHTHSKVKFTIACFIGIAKALEVDWKPLHRYNILLLETLLPTCTRNITGTNLACAMASHVFGSGISMLDKLLMIVFAMKSDFRLGRKASVVLASSLLLVTLRRLCCSACPPNRTNDAKGWLDSTRLPIDQSTIEHGAQKWPTGFAAGSQIALVLLQLASFVLYVPIFIVTNLVFFTVPIISSSVFFELQCWRTLTTIF